MSAESLASEYALEQFYYLCESHREGISQVEHIEHDTINRAWFICERGEHTSDDVLHVGIVAPGGTVSEDSLEKIYGERDKGHLRETLYDAYLIWLHTAEASEEERQREGFATPEQCEQNIVFGTGIVIRRVRRHQKVLASIGADRTKLRMLGRSVPDSPALDRVLRCEASIERAFDRTLSQLERVRRTRRGQPVPP